MPLLSTVSLAKSLSALTNLDTMRDFKPKLSRTITRLVDADYQNFSYHTEHLLRKTKRLVLGMQQEVQSGKHTFDVKLPNEMQGNRSVWEVASLIIDNIKNEYVPKEELRHMNHSTSIAMRVASETSNGTFPASKMMLQHGDDHHSLSWYNFLRAWSLALGRLARGATAVAQRRVGFEHRERAPIVHGLSMVRIDNLYIIETNEASYWMLTVHLERLEQLLRNLANLVITAAYSSFRYSPAASIRTLFCAFLKNARRNPEACGEYAKAARTILIARQDRSNIFDKPLWLLIAEDLSDEKRFGAEVITEALEEAFVSNVDRLIYSNIYKITPNPEANLKKAFEKIQGITCPNRVDPRNIPMFRGASNKSLILSMLDMGHQVRCLDGFGDGALIDMINASSVNKAELNRTHPLRFADLKLLPIARFQNFQSTYIPVSDKSSAPDKKLSDGRLNELTKTMAGHIFAAGSANPPNIKPINDVVTVLKGENKLNLPAAIRRFEHVVRMHEAFEARFPGVEIEDIPDVELISFLKENPDMTYLVLTEPKLTEVHKEITRIFYMGEQELKVLTQGVERLAKQISKRQAGVSIVKTYSARRRDLEQFADRMRSQYGGSQSLFMSFDMTSFSMKFPMPLIRVFGDTLSAITGESWMRRIDLFFRNSIIVHNTRGYFNYIAGVKGGFEGFLNFVWSSIHATIMEIALHEAGLQGTLLAYSDDGLLHISLPADFSKQQVRDLIGIIRGVYQRFGLEFHLGKTLVSHNIWEYLGDICLDGRILPQWVKEACAVGRSEEMKGFNSFYTRLTQMQGQCSALALAGFNAQASHFIGIIETVNEIRKVVPLTNAKCLFWLLVLPPRCGGFRMPSPFMMSTASSLEPDSDFIADLHFISKTRPEEVQVIIEHILDNPPTKMSAITALLEGHRISTSLPAVNGAPASSWIIEQIRKKAEGQYKLVDHPLPPRLVEEIYHYMTMCKNVNVQTISELIKATPQWKDFNDTMAIVRSRSTQSLLGEDVIRRAERKDKILVVKAIAKLGKSLNRYASSYHNPLELHTVLLKTILPKLSLTPLRPQFRVIANSAMANPDITVVFDLTSDYALIANDITYIEPTNLAKSRIESLSWMAEYTSSRIEDQMRKFCRVAASAVTSSPQSARLVVAISRLFGIEVPALTENTRSSLNRIRGHTGERPDISTHYFGLLKSRSRIDLSLRMRQLYETKRSVDRTTYIEAARWHAAHAIIEAGVLGRKPPSKVISYDFSLITMGMFVIPETELSMNFQLPRIIGRSSEAIEREFEGALFEAQKAVYDSLIIREHIAPSFDIANKTAMLQSAIIFEVFSEDISNWLYALLFHDPGTGIQNTLTLPSSYCAHQEIVTDALRKCLLHYMEMRFETKKALYQWAVASNLKQLAPFPQTLVEGIQGFMDVMEDAMNFLPSSLIDEQITNTALLPTNELQQWLVTHIFSKSMLTNIAVPLVAIEHTHARTRDATASRIHAIDNAVSAAISLLYSIGKDSNWSHDKMQHALTDKKITFKSRDIDWLLDMLAATASKLRESKHRLISHPYNERALAIEIVKMQMAIEDLSAGASTTDEELLLAITEYRMPAQACRAIMTKLAITNENPDLIRFISSSLPIEIAHRAKIWIKQKRRSRTVETPWSHQASIGHLIDEIRRSASAFHATFVAGVIRNIHPYHTATRAFLTDELEQLERPSVRVVPYKSTNKRYRGVAIGAFTDDEAILAGTHIAILLTRTGITKCACDASVDGRVGMFLAANQRSLAVAAAEHTATSARWAAKSLTIINYVFETALEGSCALLHLYNESRCSLTLFHDSVNRRYRVIGCAIARQAPLLLDAHSRNHDELEERFVATLVTSSIPSLISALHSQHSMHKVGEEPHSEVRGLVQATATTAVGHAREVRSTPYVSHNSPLLAAASILQRGVTSNADALRAYICVMAHLNDVKVPQLSAFGRSLLATMAAISKNPFARQAIANDVRVCNTWLRMNGVGSGLNIQAECQGALRAVGTVVPTFMIRLTLLIPGVARSVAAVEAMAGVKAGIPIDEASTRWLIEQDLFVGVRSSRMSAKLMSAMEEDAVDFELVHANMSSEDEDMNEDADISNAFDEPLSPSDPDTNYRDIHEEEPAGSSSSVIQQYGAAAVREDTMARLFNESIAASRGRPLTEAELAEQARAFNEDF